MISDATTSYDPPWLKHDRDGPPLWAAAMGGVLYQGIYTNILVDYAREGIVLAAWAAVGKCLYLNAEGPWLSYSTERTDQCRACLVRERQWPWNLGDAIVMVVRGECGLTMVEVELDDDHRGRMFIELGTNEDGFEGRVEVWVREEIGPMARRLALPAIQPPP